MIWFGKSAESKEQKFWSWFKKNEPALFEIHTGQEPAMAATIRQLGKVRDGLCCELGPAVDGKRSFFVSAGGIEALFPAVEALHACAPSLDRWTVVKFKTRKGPGEVRFADRIISGETVRYVLNEGEVKIGIDLFFEGFTQELFPLFANVGFILLDSALGEYDVATKVGEIHFKDVGEDSGKQSKPLSGLAEDFDRQWSRKDRT